MTSIQKKVTNLMRQLSFSNGSETASDSVELPGSSRKHHHIMRSKSGGSIPSKIRMRANSLKKSVGMNSAPSATPSAHQGSASGFLHEYLTSDQPRLEQPEIRYGKTERDLPTLKLAFMKSDLISAHTGPDKGVGIISPLKSHFTPKEPDIRFIDFDKDMDTSVPDIDRGDVSTDHNDNHESQLGERSSTSNARLGDVAGVRDWNSETDRAFGLAVSLYEINPVTSVKAGDPIADTFAVVSRENNSIIAVADGVNWGEKARLAARCAVYGSVDYLNRVLFDGRPRKFTTTDIFTALLRSFDAAHRLILAEEAALTTLACAVVAPLDRSEKCVVCVCNVGDSLAYVYSQKYGVREITKGSHCIDLVRDMRDALGALGPVDGQNPELNNLTCSMTVVEKGDIVFLTSDGVSDNFDPVVGKFAAAEKAQKVDKGSLKSSLKEKPGVKTPLQSVSALQRHELTSLRIEDILKNGIDGNSDGSKTAKKLCEDLIDFVYRLSSGKRSVLEDLDLYYDSENKLLGMNEHRSRRKQICQRIGMMPGKLDHACVVACTVGSVVESCGKLPQKNQVRHSKFPIEGVDDSSLLFPVLDPQANTHTLYDNVRLDSRPRRKDEINKANHVRKVAAESGIGSMQVLGSPVPIPSSVQIVAPSSLSTDANQCSSSSNRHKNRQPEKAVGCLVETIV